MIPGIPVTIIGAITIGDPHGAGVHPGHGARRGAGAGAVLTGDHPGAGVPHGVGDLPGHGVRHGAILSRIIPVIPAHSDIRVRHTAPAQRRVRATTGATQDIARHIIPTTTTAQPRAPHIIIVTTGITIPTPVPVATIMIPATITITTIIPTETTIPVLTAAQEAASAADAHPVVAAEEEGIKPS